MDKIFGIPMSSIMVALLLLLTICLLSVAWVAWRRPVVFKLGIRNLPRRRAQTILIVVGLMLSTLLISAALGTGDTLDYSATAATYDSLGHVDEIVIPSRNVKADLASSIGDQTIDNSAVSLVQGALQGDPNVDGIMPMLVAQVPAVNEKQGQGEPVYLAGLDVQSPQLAKFGGLKDKNGKAVDLGALNAGSGTAVDPYGVVISEKAADKLDAGVNDSITVHYHGATTTLTVVAIAPNSVLAGGVNDLNQPSIVMPLPRVQALTHQPDQYSLVLISNKGSVRDSAQYTDGIVDKLHVALAGHGLGVAPLKQDLIKQSELLANIFTSIFLVLGLFSIAAGILLIVLIFTMLAAERRPEMGMARAVGAQRRQLIQQFVAEGSGYALLAGLVGAALGVVAAIGIGYTMKYLIGQYLPITPHVAPRSLVVAYALGVVITFIAVVGSSWKISRLNVVAAVRDIPDVMVWRRKKMVLFWGILLTLIGALMILIGHNTESAFAFYGGMSLTPFGLVLILRFFGIRNRIVLTLVGLYIVTFWLLPFHVVDSIFGKTNGGFEMFFLSGIFMVIGATIVIVQNLDILLAGVSRVGGFFQSKLPAVRMAIAYPGASKGRTGMTIAMFSLIIFSLVMIATMNDNYANLFLSKDANAGWNVRANAPGANPIANFEQALRAQNVNTSDFTAVGRLTAPGVTPDLRVAGSEEWEHYSVAGMDAGFIAHSTLKFSQRATGYDSDAAIVKALQTQPNVAFVTSDAVAGGGGFGGGGGFTLTGVKSGDKTFAPVKVELAKPDGGVTTLTVIGVLDSKISTLAGLFVPQAAITATYAQLGPTSYFVALSDAGNATAVARSIEKALLVNGVQATSIRKDLQDAQKQNSGFLYLIEGFMGLGLIVGIAAVGVIAFRSVVERRQQIGMLRALGFQRSLVSQSFLIETGFVVGLGVIAGTVLGLILARNVFTSDSATASAGGGFLIPWALIAVILLATVVVALVMAWIPARQAARVVPAEALRYE